MRWDIALNTAISFVTSTNWQFYSGEGPEGVSYFVQMTGLGVQNFVSAGTGIAVMSALIRGLERRCASTLGNFWTDLTRSTLYFLVPVSTVIALLLVSQGVVQSFDGPIAVPGMDGVEQMIPSGPAASQIAIKQLGANAVSYTHLDVYKRQGQGRASHYRRGGIPWEGRYDAAHWQAAAPSHEKDGLPGSGNGGI